jgi:hypothetical protein
VVVARITSPDPFDGAAGLGEAGVAADADGAAGLGEAVPLEHAADSTTDPRSPAPTNRSAPVLMIGSPVDAGPIGVAGHRPLVAISMDAPAW